MIIGRCRENGTIACTFQCVYNPASNMSVFSQCALFAATILLVCMNLLTFQIRMKTAEDLKRLITTGFSNKKWLGSAHNITT